MTRSIKADGSTPSVESILRKDVSELRDMVGSLVAGSPSGDAKAVLERASELRARIRGAAAVLRDPSPSSVSAYLRAVASDVSAVGSARRTASSLRLLQAVIARR